MPLLLLSKTFRRLLALVVLLVLAVPVATALSVWWTARGDDRTQSDVIVVLGASQFDGRPSSVLEARLEHAEELYDEGVAPRVVTVGGGQPGDRYTEARAGERYLEDQGVEDVIAVEEGSDTLESLEAVSALMADRGWQTAVLVTDPWHAMRSLRMADDAGIEAVSSPTRRGPSVRTRSTEVRYIARETAAYLYYRAFGSSNDAGPAAV